MILQAEFVPQDQMFMHRWFQPKYHKQWYYYHPLSKPLVSNKKDHEIIKTLDEPLRDLFMHLTLNGYKTLPSCSGHFLKTNQQREKYLRVLNDLAQIKTNGLVLKDTETDKIYRYRNPSYPNLWSSFNNFKDQLDTHTRVGYIGIIKPPKHIELADGPIEMYTDRKYFDIPVTHIKINNQKETDSKPNWNKVLEIVKNLFRT